MGSVTAKKMCPAHHRAAANASEMKVSIRFAASSSRQEGHRAEARATQALGAHGQDDRGRPA